jgi:hypothetical protein
MVHHYSDRGSGERNQKIKRKRERDNDEQQQGEKQWAKRREICLLPRKEGREIDLGTNAVRKT